MTDDLIFATLGLTLSFLVGVLAGLGLGYLLWLRY